MVKLVDKQNIFNSGILSTKLYSRDDLKQYNNGVAAGMNFICSRYGPMEKRVGTNFIWDLANPNEKVYLLPFVFSIKQSVLLEFLDKKIRFYTFDGKEFGPIANPSTGLQYEITTPFTADQLDKISYVQSLDVIYLAFSDRTTPPYTLSRYANNDWRLEKFVTEDGPYLDQNYSTSKKMQITDKNTTTSTVKLTGFTLGAADVGRWIRICTPRYNENTYAYEDKWSYGKIATVASGGATITVTWSYRNIVSEDDQSWMTTATSEWRLGVWHTGTGNKDYPVTYPTKVSIHQQRLVWAGMTDKPWVWTSNSFAYKNYAPCDYEGEISDTNSIAYDISTDKVSDIFWITSVRSLLIGTELGELRMYSAGTAITPSDVVTNRESSYGCHNAIPIVTDDMIIFVQRLQRTLRSMSYDKNSDSFIGPELTVLAEHLTSGGIKKIVFQKEPNNTIWCLKEDGELLTLTYDKAQDVIGWSQCKLAGTGAIVTDLAILPSSDYQQDMVLFVVERTVNGQKKRYLELLSKNFTDDVHQKDACFVDCSMKLEADIVTITGYTGDAKAGDRISITRDNKTYNYEIVKPYDSTTKTAATGYEMFDIIDGLDYLEGETVIVTDEGALTYSYIVGKSLPEYDEYGEPIVDEEGNIVYVPGSILLDAPVKDCWVGLPYEAYFETLERDFQDKQISTKMSKLRVYKFRMYIDRTVGITIKRLEKGSETELMTFDPSKKTDEPPTLLTGKYDIEVPSAWDCDYRLRITSEPGLPCTIAGIIIGVEINEI